MEPQDSHLNRLKCDQDVQHPPKRNIGMRLQPDEWRVLAGFTHTFGGRLRRVQDVLLTTLGVAGVIAALFLIIATPGLVVTNAMAGAISSAGARAGAASALIGVMQFAFGTVGSGIVGYLHDPTDKVMALVIMLFAAFSLWICSGLRRGRVPVVETEKRAF